MEKIDFRKKISRFWYLKLKAYLKIESAKILAVKKACKNERNLELRYWMISEKLKLRQNMRLILLGVAVLKGRKYSDIEKKAHTKPKAEDIVNVICEIAYYLPGYDFKKDVEGFLNE